MPGTTHLILMLSRRIYLNDPIGLVLLLACFSCSV